jgi:hypothetical protein
MTRSLGIVSLVVVLAIGAYVFAEQAKTSGPSSPPVQQEVGQAQTAVSATNFEGAAESLQAEFAQSGSYAGATLPPGSGVVLVRADATSYCLQATAPDGSAEHEAGPGGQPLQGPC